MYDWSLTLFRPERVRPLLAFELLVDLTGTQAVSRQWEHNTSEMYTLSRERFRRLLAFVNC